MLLDLFRSRGSLEAEVIALRQQLNVLRRSAPKRPALKMLDRFIFVCLYRLAPSVLEAMTIVRPDTIVRWHRAGFRTFWRWKSRPGVGRPKVASEVRRLTREISLANPLWGAPRIRGELLKLGINVDQSAVAWNGPSSIAGASKANISTLTFVASITTTISSSTTTTFCGTAITSCAL